MIIKIEGNKDYIFPDTLSVSDRLSAVNQMLQETVTFYNGEMTVEDYFRETWTKRNTIIAIGI